jgi:hypothetical protein
MEFAMDIRGGENTSARNSRRAFRWLSQVRQLVREYKERVGKTHFDSEAGRRILVTKMAQLSGNPRDACLRFLRQSGITGKRSYGEWTKPEEQRLLDMVTTMPVEEAAKILRRSPGSVRSMLYRLGMGGKAGREWFTKFSLSRVLRTRADEVQKWIDRGWLKSRTVDANRSRVQVIDADDFCAFVKQHGREAVGRRLKYETLWFVQNYVFPPSHAELLSVRGTYKKYEADDATDPNTESQSACGSEEDGGQEG